MASTLLVTHKQLGDILLLQPAIAYLQRVGGSPVHVLTRSGMRPLIGLMPGAVYKPNPGLRWYSRVYCMDHLRKSAVRSLFSLSLHRTVILRESSERESYHKFGFKRIVAPGLGDEYVAHYYWEAVGGTDENSYQPPRLDRPPANWRPEPFPHDKWIVLNPTSGWKSKNWTVEKWTQVCSHLLATQDLPVFITTGGQEWQRKIGAEIATSVSDPKLHLLAGETTLEHFIWLVANSALVVTVDGMASHLATAYEVPSVTLFGPTSVENWHRHTPINLVVQAPDLGDTERFTIHLDHHEVIAAIDRLNPQA